MKRKLMPKYGIKGKLISALCMLLVALIMVVSSTYAWFTLSTAPEVKGISTAVGANGALEIRLNTTTDPGTVKNSTYGNLVDLSEGYGLDTITLLPSALHLDDAGKIDPRFLNIPQYGPDGRVTDVSGERTQAGIFTDGVFSAAGDNDTGVRAVGVASGLTPRQLAYRNAKYAASTNASLATNGAANSLNTNGAVLGNIVIKKATMAGATYTQAEIDSLQAIVDDLKGTDSKTGILTYIEDADKQMIVAYAASAKLDSLSGVTDVTVADAVYSTVKSEIESGNLTLDEIAASDAITVEVGGTSYSFDLAGNPILTAIDALAATKANIADAQEALDDLKDLGKTEYEWADVSGVLSYLIYTDAVTVNGMSASEIQAEMDTFAQKVMSEGINIQLNGATEKEVDGETVPVRGAGVYAEIADQCGNYSAAVTMTNVTVKGMTFEELTANMVTKSNVSPAYLTLAQTAIINAGEPSGSTSSALPMTEFYGYVIDLVFRTNAASSNLLLQTDATDRIYEGNANELTQGGGSSMTFKSASADFSTEQVKSLMGSIRIVFFGTESREVLGYAKLDVANATIGADGVTAKMYLYEIVDGAEVLITTKDDSVITAMAQNQEVKVSTLVYLDGENLENKDVAATGSQSVTGKMNLQFSSSANLTPMEYGDLHISGGATETEASTETTETTEPNT